MTTVVSVRGISGAYRSVLVQNPDFLYVGRAFAGWPGSIWGNPFKPCMDPFVAMRIMDRLVQEGHARKSSLMVIDGRFAIEDAVEWYREYIQTDRRLWNRIGEVRGKTLGCWCGHWSPGERELQCHAVVLAKLANELEAS